MTDGAIKIKVQSENHGSGENPISDVAWNFEERPLNVKNREWLWAMAIIGVAVIIFSLMLKDYLLIIIVVLTAFIIYASKNKTPEVYYFKLDSEGLHINDKFYHYEIFKSFWILPDKEIAFRRQHHLMPLLIVPFHGQEESDIRKIISNHLPENEEEEPFLDLLRKRFF